MIPGNPYATGAKNHLSGPYMPPTLSSPTTTLMNANAYSGVSHPPISPDPVIDETFEGSSSTILSVMNIGDNNSCRLMPS